jgi:plastocyanin
VALDTAAADKLVKDDSEIQPQPDPATGKKLWTVKVGDTTPDNSVTVLGFLPQRLVIGAGDKVNFHNPGQEFHTVTFPRQINGGFGFPPEPVPGQSLGVYPSNIGAAPFPTAVENPAPVPYGMGGLGLFPACEQPTSPVPAPPAPATIEIPAPFAPIVGCPNTGNNPEIKVMPWMSEDHQAPMSLVATPATYHDSGILVPQGAPVWQSAKPAPATGSFESDFEAVFPVSPVGFEYACNIHPGFMRGSISVAGLPVDVKVTPPSATTPPGPDPVGKSVSVTLPKVEGAGDPQGGQTVTVTPPGVSTSGTGPVPSSATVTAPKVDGADQHQGGQRVKVTTPTASADPGTASANATLPKVEGDITSQGGQNIKVTGPKASPAAGPGVTGLSSVSVTPPKVEVTGQPTVGADPITLLLPTVVQNPDGSTTITVYLPTNGQPITVTIPKLT